MCVIVGLHRFVIPVLDRFVIRMLDRFVIPVLDRFVIPVLDRFVIPVLVTGINRGRVLTLIPVTSTGMTGSGAQG